MIRAAMRRDLPSGTVTFLFTDVEGSTRVLHELGEKAYAAALAEHRRLIRSACAVEAGVEVDTQGDAFFFAFPNASGALEAAHAFTEALAAGPIQVRVGLHTGTPLLAEEGYVGDDVHFAARVAASGHGGQVILSAATVAAIDPSNSLLQTLSELGEHRLKDIQEAVALYQLGQGGFPPLKTISNTNLPRPASSFVGRERELREVLERIEGGARFLTLTGPGGSGKTRLAIEAAATLVGQYKAGVFWVGLATLRDPGLVTETIAQTLGAKDGLAEHVGERELLLLLDNLEQVIGAAPDLATLLETCPNLTLLATSRELLRVRGEVEYAVPPLAQPEAIALFCARSQLEPSAEIAELCARLDSLPLAVELAAARGKALTVSQILERLSQRLDLLTGGRDADPRQQTLRATIEWSYDLLTLDEQRLFAALSVFAGGCTLEAAGEVAEADLDTLQSLVEKSLVRFTDSRYWMLETIREYAAERLEATGDGDVVRRRHALHFHEMASRLDAALRAGDPEEGPVSALGSVIDNLRAAVQFGLEAGEVSLVRDITASLPMYWIVRGLHREGRSWVERALALDEEEDDARRRLLSALGTLAYAQGDHAVAVSASDEAASLASRLGGATERLDLLREQAIASLMKGELEAAERLFAERLEVALAVDNGVVTSSCRLNLVSIANKSARHDRAEQLLAENLPFVRSRGQARCEAYTLAGLAETSIHRGRPKDALADSLAAATRALQIEDTPLALASLELFAAAAAARGDSRSAAVVLGATEAVRQAKDIGADADEEAVRARALATLDPTSSIVEEAWSEGRALGLDEAVGYARASLD
jgi:predicted ATPase/class 3 adenylate cyclase